MQKSIVVGGFSKEQREKELEKVKEKYSKKGYKYIDYLDNGALKSVAVFEVDEALLKKEKARNLVLLGAFFLVLSGILFLRAEGVI